MQKYGIPAIRVNVAGHTATLYGFHMQLYYRFPTSIVGLLPVVFETLFTCTFSYQKLGSPDGTSNNYFHILLQTGSP